MEVQHTVVDFLPSKTAYPSWRLIKVACPNCRLNRLCLPHGLTPSELDQLNGIIKRGRPLERGEHLYRQGEDLHSLYVVMSGSAKSYITAPDGAEQILGFYLPGELLGLDALEHKYHTSSAVALERTVLCELPYVRFEELCLSLPALSWQMQSQFSKELARDHEVMLLIGQRGVEERLALFLLSLSARLKERGFSETEFNLSMSRHDIASFLGVATETVSRSFSRLEKDGLLSVERKLVRIKDLERLKAMVGRCSSCGTLVTDLKAEGQ